MNASLQIILFLLFLLFFFKLFIWRGNRLDRFYHAINQLQNVFFEIYIARNYEENIFYYEKLVHQYNLQALFTLRCVDARVQRIFEVIQSIGQLRYRLLEKGTFEMLENELKIVNKTLKVCLKSRGKYLLDFYNSIEKLQATYQGTVQTSSANPWPMVFFIQDLYNLHKELKHE